MKTVLFDLDGTLLPLDQEAFGKAYIFGMAKYMTPYGYDLQELIRGITVGTGAMVKNDGADTNEEVFWRYFSRNMGRDARADEPYFEEYYRTEFQKVREVCGINPKSAEAIAFLKKAGCRVALATNPLFPRIATHSRVAWAGMNPADFDLITTYENSRHCKPNPEYYRDVVADLGEKPENCIMVGNDVDEDILPARQVGMKTFLLEHSLLNRKGRDLTGIEGGGFAELKEFLLKQL